MQDINNRNLFSLHSNDWKYISYLSFSMHHAEHLTPQVQQCERPILCQIRNRPKFYFHSPQILLPKFNPIITHWKHIALCEYAKLWKHSSKEAAFCYIVQCSTWCWHIVMWVGMIRLLDMRRSSSHAPTSNFFTLVGPDVYSCSWYLTKYSTVLCYQELVHCWNQYKWCHMLLLLCVINPSTTTQQGKCAWASEGCTLSNKCHQIKLWFLLGRFGYNLQYKN